MFLSQAENELFEIKNRLATLTFSKRIVDKGSCIIVWDRADFLREAEKQLSEKNVYQEV